MNEYFFILSTDWYEICNWNEQKELEITVFKICVINWVTGNPLTWGFIVGISKLDW